LLKKNLLFKLLNNLTMKISKLLIAVFLSASVLFFGCKPKDSDIQSNITQKFTATPELSGVNASVSDGVATLTGEVKDDAAKQRAETDAKDTKGVKSVVNNITVSAPPPPPAATTATPHALTQGVADATKDYPGVTATVNNGEITLTGSIKRSDLTKLMQTLNTLHPTKINNQLTIK
jgi:hyperosmotically inducible periplasmic protein